MTTFEDQALVELRRISGGSGSSVAGGGGDASAANQTTQITAEQAIRDRLPATIGQKTAAASMSVVLSSDGPFASNFGLTNDSAATTDTGTFSFMSLVKRLLQSLTTIATNTGAGHATGSANLAVTQVTASGTAATLVIARATRRRVTIRNTDASLTAVVGPATVTAGNGFAIPAGQSFAPTWVGLIQVIAASGSPVLHCFDEYD